MKRTATLTAVAAFVLAFGLAEGAVADTHVVDSDGEGTAGDCDIGGAAFSTIQAAINAAAPGDTVAVCPGEYEEDLTIFDRDGLTLTAVDKLDRSTTIIQGVATNAAANFPQAFPNIDLQSHGVTITGFTIRSPASTIGTYASGLVIDGADNKIYNNAFEVSCGTPGSVAIQTYFNDIGSEGLQDISGLTIVENSFNSSGSPVTGCRGYEGIFVNTQSDVDVADPVIIAGNSFAGRLYRGVGAARSFTDVKFNTFGTTLFVEMGTTDFGDIPQGITLFGGTTNSVVASNSIIGGFIFFLPRFNQGIDLRDGTSDNIVRNNFVLFSQEADCEDLGTDNILQNNTGPNSTTPPGCNNP